LDGEMRPAPTGASRVSSPSLPHTGSPARTPADAGSNMTRRTARSGWPAAMCSDPETLLASAVLVVVIAPDCPAHPAWVFAVESFAERLLQAFHEPVQLAIQMLHTGDGRRNGLGTLATSRRRPWCQQLQHEYRPSVTVLIGPHANRSGHATVVTYCGRRFDWLEVCAP
jgi:hypothetical protein